MRHKKKNKKWGKYKAERYFICSVCKKPVRDLVPDPFCAKQDLCNQKFCCTGCAEERRKK